MNTNTMQAVPELKAERVQEEAMAVGEPGAVQDPLVISLKAERVQEPAVFAGPVERREASFLELAVNPYQRVVVELPALGVNITLEQPVAGASWNISSLEGG